MDSEIFLKLSPTKLFFRCAVPAVVSSVFGALYSVVDGMFVGRYLGEDALAAINLVMPVLMIVSALSNMIATGSSVNISMLLGERKQEEASRIFSFSLCFIFGFSCLISLLGLFLARPIVLLLAPGATEEATTQAARYLMVFAAFGPLIPVYFATDNYLRVCGREKLSMWLTVATQLLNVVLDFLLIAVFKQGIRAAAVASCISMVLGSVITLALFTRKRMDIYYTKPSIQISRFLRIVANGSSEFFSSIAMSVMSVILNLFLLNYGGTTAVAAFSIVMYVDSIIGMFSFGICDSLQPAISYCYGAGEIMRMKAIFKRVLIATMTVSAVAFLFMLCAGPAIAPMFIEPGDAELLEVSRTAIRIFAFSYLAGWIDMTYSSYFTALDMPVRSLIVSLSGTLVFPIAFLFLLSHWYGLNGVWMMPVANSAASGILTLVLAKTIKPDTQS